jgi:hypothetical protein
LHIYYSKLVYSVTIVNLLAARPIQISTIVRTIPITTSIKTTSVEITAADHPTSSAPCLIKATEATKDIKDMEDTKATRATEVIKTTGRVTQVTGKVSTATEVTEVTEDMEVTEDTASKCRTPTSLCSRQLLKVLVAHLSSKLARMCLPKVLIRALEDLHPSEEQRWSCVD